MTNLREVLAHKMKKNGESCQCLRCREIARHKDTVPAGTTPELFDDIYKTLGGTEHFITLEDKERTAVFGFLRLRVPHKESRNKKIEKLMPEIKDCAFIREVHVYGQLVRIGKQNQLATQHKGYGKRMMKEAERIAKEAGFKKVAVISGVGVRGYYRKLGYRKVGTYMVKSL